MSSLHVGSVIRSAREVPSLVGGSLPFFPWKRVSGEAEKCSSPRIFLFLFSNMTSPREDRSHSDSLEVPLFGEVFPFSSRVLPEGEDCSLFSSPPLPFLGLRERQRPSSFSVFCFSVSDIGSARRSIFLAYSILCFLVCLESSCQWVFSLSG